MQFDTCLGHLFILFQTHMLFNTPDQLQVNGLLMMMIVSCPIGHRVSVTAAEKL
jgi:hypothetical protein